MGSNTKSYMQVVGEVTHQGKKKNQQSHRGWATEMIWYQKKSRDEGKGVRQEPLTGKPPFAFHFSLSFVAINTLR